MATITRPPALLMTVLLAALLTAPPARAFIDVFRPETLGAVCGRADSITVLRVDKVSKEKGVIIFSKVKDLKGKLPREAIREVLGDAHLPAEKKRYLDWVDVGKTAVVFRYENRLAICVGEQWTVCDAAPPKDEKEAWTVGTRTEPWFLKDYCGDADKLPGLVTDVLAGKEVIAPVMLGEREKELRDRTGKLVRLRVSLKRKDFNLPRDLIADEKK